MVDSKEWIAICSPRYSEEFVLCSILKSNRFAVNAVPQKLQNILNLQFDFQLNASVSMNSDYWISITKYCKMWLNPKTRKIASLMYEA